LVEVSTQFGKLDFMDNQQDFVEAIESLIKSFEHAYKSFDISCGYVPPLHIETTNAVADYLAQEGKVSQSGYLRTQTKLLKTYHPSFGPIDQNEREGRKLFKSVLGRVGPFLEKVKGQIAISNNIPYLPLTKAQHVFGFKSTKELTCFLERNPDVKQDRPKTKDGKPNQRRRLIDVLSLSRAISRDDTILSDPARKRKMEARLKNAKLNKELENQAIGYLFGNIS
jgi:hypothetical protein